MQRTVLALCLTIAFTNLNVNAMVFADAPAETIQSLLAEAAAAQARGDFRSTAEAYRKATELEPSIPELWARPGLMYHAVGGRFEVIVGEGVRHEEPGRSRCRLPFEGDEDHSK